MTSKKSNRSHDIASVAKIVVMETGGGLNEFRKRYVGWVPFLAFWALVYFFVQIFDNRNDEDAFRAAGLALLYLAGALGYCLIFFIVAACQYGVYRKTINKKPIPAVAAMVLHGAVVAYIAFGFIMLFLGH
jgi:hypothetical protein